MTIGLAMPTVVPSLGEIVGETLRCGYHGLRFDCEGACVEIPGQVNIPPRAKVRAYRVVDTRP